MSFLLALGQFTETPFRCMDEYDVYMDEVTRLVATETLLEFAYEQHEHQYVFLTPLNIQAVETAKSHLGEKLGVAMPPGFVKMVQMRPPRANATRL
eukprot:CAMPEP_0202894572 /NCGR_PEP_ID=MMETSP1392-20130828/3954_1 /ASSEMBLY_ACC=CAM_ASM_000868 /TAXON_ID=225041 /ORGANISM="Chlamydomonas chlamydogama, Strain SAG 11-48b" /LENGTH=95 /DNA_ID=CAMNT_0049579309 /DNA_START=34 /DNA_END=321 /DNA_ORIENTATION=+